jgi:hypothetical protein
MARRTKIEVCHSTTLVVAFLLSWARVEAQTFNELIDGAKKESEMSFVAGAHGLAESEPESKAKSCSSIYIKERFRYFACRPMKSSTVRLKNSGRSQ